MYQKTEEHIYRIKDTAWIPKDPDNTDYQEFLKYLTDNKLTLKDIPDLKE